MSSLRVAQKATRVLVAGGSYAGLSVTLNLLDLCNGLSPRFSGTNTPADRSQQTPVEVTIVDERDGFCAFFVSHIALLLEIVIY